MTINYLLCYLFITFVFADDVTCSTSTAQTESGCKNDGGSNCHYNGNNCALSSSSSCSFFKTSSICRSNSLGLTCSWTGSRCTELTCSTMVPCAATNIVPINGGSVAVPPSAPVSSSSIESKNPSGVFSIQAMKSKISDIINPQKSQAVRRGTYSGSCGTNVSWFLDTDTGVLTISGTGAMTSYSSNYAPWYNYRSSIKTVIIENGVTSIGSEAFSGCSSLTSINIPNSVTSIGDYAFKACSSLTSINIPDKVTSIGSYAFFYCSSLTSINIPDSVTSIGIGAFAGCSKLTSINVNDTNPNYKSIDGILFNKAVTRLISCPATKTSVNIPNSVTSIGYYAFDGCSKLTSINIPNSVTSIGDHAFEGCSSLTSINIPDKVTSIASSAFSGCSSLPSINIPDSVTSIYSSAFQGCSSLQYNEHDNALYLGNSENPYHALIDPKNTSITSCQINDNTKVIADSAFWGCSSLTSINIPDKVTSIGDYAFNGCSSLTSINVNDNNSNYKSIDGILFNKAGTNLIQCPEAKISVSIPDSVISIGDSAFRSCSKLTSINIPDKVTSIGGGAFAGCSKLTSINIPDSVTSIGGSAFSYCRSLSSVAIGNGVTSIGDDAFAGCSSLTSINIPDKVTSIGYEAFRGCSSLQYNEHDNALYLGNSENPHHALIKPKDTSITSCQINDNTKVISGSAFNGCSKLTLVNIPDKVTSIGYASFKSCSNLTSVTIGNSVTSIGYYAFKGCSSLTSINIPDSVTSIESGAFYGCSSLKSITIPGSVSNIGLAAFKDCSALSNVCYLGITDTKNDDLSDIPANYVDVDAFQVFAGCPLNKVIVPKNYKDNQFCKKPVSKEGPSVNSSESSKSGLSAGAIAGIVIGSLAAVAAAV